MHLFPRHGPPHLGHFVGALVCVVATTLPGATAWALEPDKDLSQYPQSKWTQEQGVVGEFILAMAETKDGFLWVGTRSAFLRFDGVTFTEQMADDARVLGRERVETLLPGDAGTLYIGTDNGLVQLQNHHYKMLWRTRHSIHTLVAARGGGLWVGTTQGVHKIVNGVEKSFVGQNLVREQSVRSLLETTDGTLWIGCDEGLLRLHGGTLERFTGAEQPGTRAIRSLLLDQSGTLWVGAAGPALFKYAAGAFTMTAVGTPLPDAYVTALAKDNHGNLWVGTTVGLGKLTPKGSFRLYDGGQGLDDIRVASLLVDSRENLWVGTKGGLAMFHDGEFTAITTRQGLPSDTINVTLLTRRGRLWVGSADQGLFVWENNRAVPFGAQQGLNTKVVRTLFEDKNGTLYVGGPDGLFKNEGDRFTRVTAEAAAQPDVGSLAEASAGGLWVGTKGSGLMRVKDDRLFPVTLSSRISGWVRPVYEDRGGRLWMGAQDGRLLQAAGETGRVTEVPIEGARFPRAFYEDAQGLWVGFRGVLARFQNDVWHLWTAREGLPATSMSQIIADNEANLWLGGASGIFRVPLAQVARWLRDPQQAPVPSYQTFRRADGLQSAECSLQPGTSKTADGRLWFPTMGGIATIAPARPTPAIKPPQVHILNVDVDGKAYPVGASVVAPPGPGTLAVEYTAPYFRDPRKLRFRYRLAGFDRDWVNGDDRRFARYNNIPPGDYRFEVLASHSENQWPPQRAGIDFHLTPKFYQRALFKLTMVVLALAAISLALRLRVVARQRRETLLREERTRIARDLHDNLDQSLFATTLQLDLAQKRLATPDEASPHILMARNLLTHFQEEARRSIADLRSQAFEDADAGLQKALHDSLMPLATGTATGLEIHVDRASERAPLVVKNELLHVAQELTTNALRHAGPTHISVAVTSRDGATSLVVIDDGCGFDPKAAAGAAQGHFGLAGVGERAQWLGGAVTVKPHQPHGTRIEIKVPLATAAANPR